MFFFTPLFLLSFYAFAACSGFPLTTHPFSVIAVKRLHSINPPAVPRISTKSANKMTPPPYIILRQVRETKTKRFPDGTSEEASIIDFKPILAPTKEPHTLFNCNSPEEALALAKIAYPRFHLAVQPALEYFQCHQPPTQKQPFPKRNG